MNDSSHRRKVVRGVAWAGAASWGGQLLGFVIYAGLARLLSPEAFGLVAIAGIYIAFIQLLVAQGFGMAIVQRESVDDRHLDSAFWIAIASAFVLCLLSHVFGPQIGRFFGEPQVTPVIGWLSFSLFFHAMSSVQIAILTREMDFRSLAIRSLLATLLGGAVGLTMAFRGWGVWSLVGQQLTNAILSSLIMWWAVSWRPAFRLSPTPSRSLQIFVKFNWKRCSLVFRAKIRPNIGWVQFWPLRARAVLTCQSFAHPIARQHDRTPPVRGLSDAVEATERT